MMRLPVALLVFVLLAAGLVAQPATGLSAQEPPAPFWENTLDGLRAAVEKDPENAGLRVRLAQAILRAGKDTVHPDVAAARIKEAQVHLDKVLSINPRAVVPLRVQALDSYSDKRFEQTVAVGQRLLEVAPADVEVSRHLLKALVKLRKLDEASDFFVAWLKTGTTPSFGSLQGLASNLLQVEGFGEIFGQKLDAACAANPNDVFLLLVKGMYLVENGRMEAAWAAIHEAERKGLCDTRTGARHAFVAALKGKGPEFEQKMPNYDGLDLEGVQARVATNPDHAGLLLREARLLDLAGRTSEALPVYEKVRKLNPQHWAAWYRPGELLMQEKDPRAAEAAPLLERAHQIFPAYIPGVIKEAEAWARAGKADKAIALIVEAGRAMEPGKALTEVIKILAGLDEGAAGGRLVAALGTAITAEPKNPYLLATLALALYSSGKQDLARKEAVAGERAGLSGRDGYPSSVLFTVFERPEPKVDDRAESVIR